MTGLPPFRETYDFLLLWSWKSLRFLRALVICELIVIAALSVAFVLQWRGSGNQLRDLKNENQSLRTEKEQITKAYTDLQWKFNSLGVQAESVPPLTRSATDFSRDWDTSNFYIKDGSTYCPKKTGGNNYQRMTHKHSTPVLGSDLSIKFSMVDENTMVADYDQRLVVGFSQYNLPIAEFDIPTRLGEVINYRVASENGVFMKGSDGISLSSPIKTGSGIFIRYKTQPKHGQDFTHVVDIRYISSKEQYGDETISIARDSRLENDPNPETGRGNLFLGSYIGGCIKIIDWSAS